MAKVKIKKRKAGNIAYIEHKGAYHEIPYDKYYEKLYSWAKENKARPGFKQFAIYPNNPNETPEKELLTQIAISIGKMAEPKGDIKVKTLPETEVAVIKHNAPAEEYNNTYAELLKWVEENDYEVSDNPIEMYTKKPKVKQGKTIIYSEIQFPVEKK